MNPQNWSAKAQALLALLLGLVVEYLNAKFGAGIPTGSASAAGVTGAVAVAHIDNGEPAAAPATAPASTIALVNPADAPRARLALSAANIPTAAGLLLALAILVGCATSPQSGTVAPKGELGQGSTHAAASFLKSTASNEGTAESKADAPITAGSLVTVPFALWNGQTNSWQIPLDKDGKPYVVTASAVRDFNYLVGTITNSATISGTASGTQTQAGQTGATATPTNTVSPTTNVTVPAAGGAVVPAK